MFYLGADDVDASVVGGVEFEDLFAEVGAVDPASNGEDCGCFASSGGAVEEEVREAVLGDERFDW